MRALALGPTRFTENLIGRKGGASMWGIGVEWWKLYGRLLLFLFSVWAILSTLNDIERRLEMLFRGEDILHADLEKVMKILENTRG